MAALGSAIAYRRPAWPGFATFSRQSRRAPVSALILALTVLFAPAGVTAPRPAGASFSFSDCGTVVEGVSCQLFRSDHNGTWRLISSEARSVGERLFVTGTTDPGCATVCQEGQGCLEVSAVTACEAGCGLCFSNPLVGQVRCGEVITLTTTVTNCGTSTVSDLAPVVQGDLLSGCGETLPVSVFFSPTTVEIGGSAELTVGVSAAGKPKACTYRGVILLGEGCTVDIAVTVLPCPALSLPAGLVSLVCDITPTPLVVLLTNTGNTDLSLSALVPPMGCPVQVSPYPINLPYGQSGQVTLEPICAGLPAGLYCCEVTLADDSLGYFVPLPVCVEVPTDSCISVALPPSPPEVLPGGSACLKIPVTNCGNFTIAAGQTLVEIGDFVPTLPGGKSIPCGQSGRLAQELPIGATDTVTVCVSVAAGIFCGTYCAPLAIPAGLGAANVVNEICFDVAGCADRPIAFSHNPVHYAQYQSVDIAPNPNLTGPVTIRIYTMMGLLVRTLADNVTLCSSCAAWDFKNDDGDLVASGMYIVSAEIGGTTYREKLLFVK
jgi:hypothetical protein